jgi:hypothetical protein
MLRAFYSLLGVSSNKLLVIVSKNCSSVNFLLPFGSFGVEKRILFYTICTPFYSLLGVSNGNSYSAGGGEALLHTFYSLLGVSKKITDFVKKM